MYKVSPKDSPALKTMLRHRQQFIERNGLLYKKFKTQVQDLQTMQFVLPKKFRIQAMQPCHNEIGHFRIERSLALLTEWFYWTGMADNVSKHMRGCARCLRFRTKAQIAKLKPLTVTHPLELVHMDFLTIKAGRETNKYAGHYWPFYKVCTSFCHTFVNCPSGNQNSMEQILCSLWTSWENFNWSGPKLWELFDKGALLCSTGQESENKPV